MSTTATKENPEQVENTQPADQPPKMSPDDKLRGTPAPGSEIPGAQNPESTEVKKELNPNSE